MTRVLKTIIITSLCICLISCNKKDNNNNNNLNSNKEEFTELKKLGIKKYDIECIEFKDFLDINIDENLFISNDGKLYNINLEQLYSNDKNCKLIENDKIFTKFISGGIIDQNNDIYYFDGKELKNFNFENGYIRMPYIKNIDKEKYQNVFLAQSDTEDINYYYFDNNKIINPINDEVIFSVDDEQIIEVRDNTIITDKTVYVYKNVTINSKECEKYADVECVIKSGFYEINNKNIISQLKNIKYIKIINDYVLVVDQNNNLYYGWY